MSGMKDSLGDPGNLGRILSDQDPAERELQRARRRYMEKIVLPWAIGMNAVLAGLIAFGWKAGWGICLLGFTVGVWVGALAYRRTFEGCTGKR